MKQNFSYLFLFTIATTTTSTTPPIWKYANTWHVIKLIANFQKCDTQLGWINKNKKGLSRNLWVERCKIGKWEKGMIRETSGLKYNIKKN